MNEKMRPRRDWGQTAGGLGAVAVLAIVVAALLGLGCDATDPGEKKARELGWVPADEDPNFHPEMAVAAEAQTYALSGSQQEVTRLTGNPCPNSAEPWAVETLGKIRKTSNSADQCPVRAAGSYSAPLWHALYLAAHDGDLCDTTVLDEHLEASHECHYFTGVLLSNRLQAAGALSPPWRVASRENANVYTLNPPVGGVNFSFPLEPTQVFDEWIANPFWRFPMFHGTGITADYAETYENHSGGGPLGHSVVAHVLDMTRSGDQQGVIPGLTFIWPEAGAQQVKRYQNLALANIPLGAPDPNGGGTGYVYTVVDEKSSQIWWQLRHMCFATGPCYDQDWRTSAGGCGVNGCLQMVTHTSHEAVQSSEAGFYTADPMSAGRWQASVLMCPNSGAACYWLTWEANHT
jgi:hypothetical protein